MGNQGVIMKKKFFIAIVLILVIFVGTSAPAVINRLALDLI
jgi:hypothetical protein